VGGLGHLLGLVPSTAEEVDIVDVGDRVLVESEKVGAVLFIRDAPSDWPQNDTDRWWRRAH
jgi:hypothetical protein